MAIIAMKKLTLIGLTQQKKLILQALHYSNCTELGKTRELADTQSRGNGAEIAENTRNLQRLESAIELTEEKITERAAAERKSGGDFQAERKPLFASRREVSFDEFIESVSMQYELFPAVEELESHAARLAEIKSESARLENQIEQVKPYLALQNIPFSVWGASSKCVFTAGLIPDTQLEKWKDFVAELPELYFESLPGNSSSVLLTAAYLKKDADAVRSALAECNYVECPFTEEVSPSQKIDEMQSRINSMREEYTKLVKSVTEHAQDLDSMRLLADYYRLELAKAEASEKFQFTEKSFVLEGWVPQNAVGAVEAAVREKTDAVEIFFSDPEEGEECPTLTQNPKLVAPYESVTNMFSVPRATERDPNIFVAMFFFLFFGIMLSDAGYGIVMTVATLLIMKLFKLETPMKKMILVLCMGGVSTIIWGAVFGTWFGVDVIEKAVPFFRKLAWFSPLQYPVKMLVLCLALGLFQILFGMGIHAADAIKQGRVWDAIFDVYSWYIFFAGILLLIFGMVIDGAPAILQTVGLIVAGSGLLIVLLTAGRKKKGIFGKILGGFGGLYNIVNFLSDVLSYSRLFGLGVATGVIGFTMNLLAGMMFDIPVIGWLFGVLILVGGHIFNLAINLLGAYIHNCRLQYVEFFGRFFEGGGYEFQPLGFDTQYVKIK